MLQQRVGRNDLCTCGSGRKFKACCLRRVAPEAPVFPPALPHPLLPAGDGAFLRPTPRPQSSASPSGGESVKRIPVHYTYDEPFGTAECVYCFWVEHPFILESGNVIRAGWLQAGARFRMEDGAWGTVTAVEPPKVWGPPNPVPDKDGNYHRRVLGTIKHNGYAVIDVRFGGQTITGTPDHLWYSASRKAWVPAQTLQRGELLFNTKGTTVPVESVSEPRHGLIELFNLEVEELHTFFVGDQEVGSALVHNGKGNYIKKAAVPTEADHIKAVAKPGRYNAVVGSEAEARRIVQTALPHSVEIPPAVAGKPYPKAASDVKAWHQVQPPEPEVNNLLPHIKYEDWTGGKKFKGGHWGQISSLRDSHRGVRHVIHVRGAVQAPYRLGEGGGSYRVSGCAGRHSELPRGAGFAEHRCCMSYLRV